MDENKKNVKADDKDKNTKPDAADNTQTEKKADKAINADAKETSDTKDVKETTEAKDSKEAEEKTADGKGKEKKDLLDDIDDGDLILEDQRVSYPLNTGNARFFRSKGGLISLDLHVEGKEPEIFERVVILRSFPVTNPDEFLSVREPDTKKQGRGKEIGMIRRITDFDEQTQMLFLEELDRRYFSPVLQKITAVKEKFGYSYWDAETSAGHVTFILNNPFSNIRVLEDGRVYINDIDGNSFEIPDPKKLDSASMRKIEIYL